MRQKKLLLSIAVMCLLLPVIQVRGTETEKGESIGQEPDYILGREMTQEEEKEAIELTKYYNEMSVTLLEEEPVESAYTDDGPAVMTLLPISYDSRTEQVITEIKNQYPYGSCWAFSTIGGLEASVLKGEILTYDSTDLSEYHLAYYTMFPVTDPIGGTQGDQTVYLLNGNEAYLNSGGNVDIAYHRLANWQGAVDERIAPYTEAGSSTLPATVESAFEHDSVHLQNAMVYNTSTDAEYMKLSIMEYGAVCISYYSGENYYNPSTAAQYCPVDTGTNHAVMVVGWDDEYKKENFKDMPTVDGAWLVKNSWGENWGDQGYFWLSYADQSIGNNAYVLQGDDANNYDHNYQYDNTILDRYYIYETDSLKIANIFETQANPDGGEALEAVSLYNRSANTDYSIQIYSGIQNMNNPESGQALLENPAKGNMASAGYYTIELDETIKLAEKQKFSVVVTLSNPSGRVGIVTESSRTSGGIIESIASSKEGQSYVGIGGRWNDWGQGGTGNIRIKAFTKDISAVEAPSPIPTIQPTTQPTATPTAKPTFEPTAQPTVIPTATPRRPVSSDFPFYDVDVAPGNWKYESVKYVYENGIMNGITNTDGTIDSFQPDEPLTRAMFATVLYRMAGQPPVAFENRFSDVSTGRYYSSAIIWAYRNGIVNGYADGSYGVDDYITREQIAKMLRIYAQVRGYSTSERVNINSFPDVLDVSGWAVEHMSWAVGCGMINGKNIGGTYYLDAKGNATRVECAAMLMRFINRYGK